MRGLRDRGLRLPDDVSIIGFDNIFAGDLVTPSLTTVAAPMGALGEAAINHIITTLGRGAPTRTGAMVVPVRLLVRESTAGVPAHE